MRSRATWLAGAALCVLPMTPALAQETETNAESAALDPIEFSADEIEYDADEDIVTARGQVRMNRDGYWLAADEVSWNRRTGVVTALGNVVTLGPVGDRIIGDRVT